MSQPTTGKHWSGMSVQRSTAHASLAALGVHLHPLDRFGPIRQPVHLAQKTVGSPPADQLDEAFMALLAGAPGLGEINGRVRPDAARQAACGRHACAEPSVGQDTRAAGTQETVNERDPAWTVIDRRHGQGSRHADVQDWQVLDVARSGRPCGQQAALATPGSVAKPRHRRGRHLGRVRATRSHEIVVDRLFDGKPPRIPALLPLVVAAEQTLELEEAKRARTLIRSDAGAGRVSDLKWRLFRGYHVLAQDDAAKRAAHLAAQVTDGVVDPHDPERQIGVVPVPADDDHAGPYRRNITRRAVRGRRATGQGGVGVGIGTLPAADALHLAGRDPALATDPRARARA